MTLHGIKLYPLRNWTPNASYVYSKVTGIVYNANDLVPAGVNKRFSNIIDLERKITKEKARMITTSELEIAWLDTLRAEI